MSELAKSYEPSEIEPKLRKLWEEKELFKVKNPLDADFSIAFPPPNVTGELHMGHALNSTLQDVLIRYNRMQGKKVHWQIGCDHAGIGTQIVVEKQIAKEGKNKYDLGRKKFEERTWEWTKQHLGKIDNQMKLLGLSPDWSKSKFTLDEDYIQAVRKHFYELFKQGLIRRGTRLINWCPHCLTSLSDLEVVHEDRKGKLYKIKYELVQAVGNLTELVVATSRPETLYGDVAVAINEKDERYKAITDKVKAGETVLAKLPLTGKTIPVILSDAVETDFGTGALKITPSHDFNDNQIVKDWNQSKLVRSGKFEALEEINIFSETAHLLELEFIPTDVQNLERFKARTKTIELLEEKELLLEEEKYSQAAALHDRCGNVIEPYLSPQWFVYMKPLAKIAIDTLKENKVKFYPERYSKTYLDWLENIQDWCISRQIWWGHKIPVWSKQANVENLSSEEAEKIHVDLMNEIKKISKETGFTLTIRGDVKRPSHIEAIKGKNEFIFQRDDEEVQIVVLEEDKDLENKLLELGYKQETDVLDTWFSSALWPFATQGWPKESSTLPHSQDAPSPLQIGEGLGGEAKPWTSALMTAREIINLWVSRMIYSAENLTGSLPFTDILIHPVIQTPDGKRMSKSKGNAINPIDLIDKYGADASRLWYCSVGIFSNQDTRFPGKKEKDKDGNPVWTSQTIEDKRKFINKLWNATKFVIQNIQEEPEANYFWKDENNEHKKVSEIINRIGEENNTTNIWILGLWNKTLKEANDHIQNYRFSEYIACLENFFWYEFCDWYLELAKLNLSSEEKTAGSPCQGGSGGTTTKLHTQQTLFYVLEGVLKSLNPVIPFATEELWQALTGEDKPLAFELYPFGEELSVDTQNQYQSCLEKLNNFFITTQSIRSVRQRILGLSPSAKLTLSSTNLRNDSSYNETFGINREGVEWFSKVKFEDLNEEMQTFRQLIQLNNQTVTTEICIPGEVDLSERKSVLQKDLEKKQKEKSQGEGRLNNQGFMQNASEEVKAELQKNVELLNQEINELAEALNQIEEITKAKVK